MNLLNRGVFLIFNDRCNLKKLIIKELYDGLIDYVEIMLSC